MFIYNKHSLLLLHKTLIFNDYDVSVRVPVFVSLSQHIFGLLGEVLL